MPSENLDFTDYFGVPYPGDKLDLVAVPDFAFGAMENLGCVTFREALVLVDPDEVTQPELQRVTDVIAQSELVGVGPTQELPSLQIAQLTPFQSYIVPMLFLFATARIVEPL